MWLNYSKDHNSEIVLTQKMYNSSDAFLWTVNKIYGNNLCWIMK